MLNADPSVVSTRAKKRGLPQLGTLGAGNHSKEGQDYLNGMAAAANFAWVNRSSMTFLARQAIAKVEEHFVNGKPKTLLVHRKGSTRAFPPHHPLIPVDYQLTGQPVLIGGTMGSCSYVLTGTEQGMKE